MKIQMVRVEREREREWLVIMTKLKRVFFWIFWNWFNLVDFFLHSTSSIWPTVTIENILTQKQNFSFSDKRWRRRRRKLFKKNKIPEWKFNRKNLYHMMMIMMKRWSTGQTTRNEKNLLDHGPIAFLHFSNFNYVKMVVVVDHLSHSSSLDFFLSFSAVICCVVVHLRNHHNGHFFHLWLFSFF